MQEFSLKNRHEHVFMDKFSTADAPFICSAWYGHITEEELSSGLEKLDEFAQQTGLFLLLMDFSQVIGPWDAATFALIDNNFLMQNIRSVALVYSQEYFNKSSALIFAQQFQILDIEVCIFDQERQAQAWLEDKNNLFKRPQNRGYNKT